MKAHTVEQDPGTYIDECSNHRQAPTELTPQEARPSCELPFVQEIETHD